MDQGRVPVDHKDRGGQSATILYIQTLDSTLGLEPVCATIVRGCTVIKYQRKAKHNNELHRYRHRKKDLCGSIP